jgi:hypothetical protein
MNNSRNMFVCLPVPCQSLDKIIVKDVNVHDWQDLLNFLHSTNSVQEFYLNNRPSTLPTWARDILIREEPDRRMAIRLYNISSVCRFTMARTIELDINPSEIITRDKERALLSLISTIGLILDKRVELVDIDANTLFAYVPGHGLKPT